MQIEWGPIRRTCEGVSRRSFLKVGTLAALGLSLPELIRQREASAASGRRPANMIFLWLDGGPSHMETFDLKPEAPAEIRGECKPSETGVPAYVADDPLSCVAIGAGRALEHFEIFRDSLTPV